MKDKEVKNNGTMTLNRAMSRALSAEELNQMSVPQVKLFRNRVALLVDKYQDQVTPEMIQGVHEIVTEYLLPDSLHI